MIARVRRAALLLPLIGVYVAAMLLLPAREGWTGDEPEYLNLAGNLTSGFYREGTDDGPLDMCFPGWQTPDLWYGPGFPAFLTPFVALDLPVSVIRLVGPLLLLASVLLLHRLLLRSVPPRAALMGALGFGLFLPFLRYLPFLHSEFLALALVVLAMVGTTAVLRGGKPWTIMATGAALAGVALTRVAFGWVLTILLAIWLIAWLVRRSDRARRLALVHGLALALCVPWLAYTYSVTDRPLLWGTSGSLSAYWMSSPYAADTGDWHCATDVFSQDWLAPHRPFFRANAGLSPVEQNRALERRAVENLREHPGNYAGNLAANASRMLFNVPYSERGFETRSLAFVIPGLVLLGFLAVTLVRLLRADDALVPEALPFALFAAVAFAVHLPISAYTRMLIPIVPLLVWLITYALAGSPSTSATGDGDASTRKRTPRSGS
jgi:4-amino-4-deoxy-L-arabinose transferase-like glycosyltransferase